MIELTEILNAPSTINNKELLDIAALLSSDEAFIYNSTYITDSQNDLIHFKNNTIKLRKLLIKYTEILKNKLSSTIEEEEEDLIWGFKLQANNSLEVLSDDISFVVVNEENESQLLKLLTSLSVTSFVLSLHFKHSKNEIINKSYKDSFDYHIQHSFKVNNNREIRKSINQFVKIVKLHLYAQQ